MGGRRLRCIGATLVTLASLTVVVTLATGEVALVTTHGISMEPRFHTGDLAVVVPGSPYRVGEIVGYHSPLLDTTVLHRIVAEHDGLFTFKGDNNSFLDPQKLPASAIKGRLWLHIPRGGVVLAWVRSPVVLGLLAFLLVALGLGAGARRRRARGPATGPGAIRSGPKHAAPGTDAVGWWPVGVAVATAVVLAALTLALWWRPTTRPSEQPVSYAQKVAFSYTASAPAGVTYPTGVVSTGDPVFPRLVQTLEVTAHYAFSPTTPGASGTPLTLSGTIGADAVLEGPHGWSSPLSSVAPVIFSGARASVAVPIDLGQIASLENEFATETRVSIAFPQIAITPTVHVHGTLEGAGVDATYAPSLTVPDNGQELDLGSTDAGVASAQSDELTPESSGSVELPTRVPARITIFGRLLTVADARRLALGGLLLSILAAIGACVWVIRRRRMDETARIHATYAHDLVRVSSSPTAQAKLVVDVETFEALARLARRYDCVILELEHAGGHAYFVECGATIYRHGPDPAAGLSAVDAVMVDPLDTAVIPAVPAHAERGLSSVPDGPSDLTYYVRAVSSAS
jgi:signal peptidase I